MIDVVSPEVRSVMMSRIRGRDTKPEMIVRQTTHALGYRYRLHRRDLPGTPDLVFPGRKKSFSSTDVFGIVMRAANMLLNRRPAKSSGRRSLIAMLPAIAGFYRNSEVRDGV